MFPNDFIDPEYIAHLLRIPEYIPDVLYVALPSLFSSKYFVFILFQR